MSWTWLHKLSSPPHAYRITGRLAPWLGWPALALIVTGLYGGLVLAPADYQQGDGFRILYVHAPSAWMSMFIYATMATAAAIGLIWRIKLAHGVAAASAPLGAWFTFLALATGSIWGKPMWGTWWVWDARLTSELILLFLYFGLMALRASIEDRERADRATAVLAIVGIVNLPIIHYSVYWWNTLHQGATITRLGKPSITGDMLWPLLVMLAGFTFYYFAVLMTRLRAEILRRERDASWLKTELSA
ncbi:MAG: heme ABC transporter permease [Steroidobacteraceae bacterium]